MEPNRPDWKPPEGKQLVFVDMDGTLADVTHRLHYIRGRRKKNWLGFFRAMDADKANPIVAEWVRQLEPEYTVVIVSGRPAEYAPITVAWLKRNGIPFSHLLMRRTDDRRPDHIVKEELMQTLPRERIAFVIDDRASVCDMWRRNGLRCFQVAEGNF